MDHPYEQPYFQLPDGTGISDLPFDYDTDTVEAQELLQRVHDYRLTDDSAVLAALPSISTHLSIPLNTTHCSLIGHSLGGSAALGQILHKRAHTTNRTHQIFGALNMDGSLWAPASTNDSSADLRIPSLLLSSSGPKGDPLFADFDALQSAWAKEINIGARTNHTNFSDLIILKQGLGIAGGEGAVGADRMVNITRTLVGSFQGLVTSKSEGVLRGTDEIRDA
ncbi:uncharacterized protein EKO05_0004700 [Ascochyta rabiei]|nr:uncharacterized protein EKO05_0004700 [Ascochyta rabiei]UPX14211.1 hypothetical protein EKO05_0004700 [Ascochyta rabiei]